MRIISIVILFLASLYAYPSLLNIIISPTADIDVNITAIPASLPRLIPTYLSYIFITIINRILVIIMIIISLFISDTCFSIRVNEYVSRKNRTIIAVAADTLI